MDALYYPFHLCHERTLQQLLQKYSRIHFRDFMGLQLTPFMGATGYPDRMGDYFPEVLRDGRIVQGYPVSGWLDCEMISSVNRDVADSQWRTLYHTALSHDPMFQRGLVAFSHDRQGRSTGPSDPAFLSALQQPERESVPYTVDTLQTMSRKRMTDDDMLSFEYGFGLVKTAAAHFHTIRLCHELGLIAVTDSASHYRLLRRTCSRDRVELENRHVKREGY